MSVSSRAGWWAGKVRQVRSHVLARVTEAERAELVAWTTDPERDLFDSMTTADRRHGLDVVRVLRAQGVTDRDVLVAGLIHDCGKGRTGLWPRVAYSLGEAHGSWVWRTARLIPGFGPSLDRLRGHAAASARLAAEAGCSSRTVELIRWQDAPRDPEFGELLRLADEAS